MHGLASCRVSVAGTVDHCSPLFGIEEVFPHAVRHALNRHV